MKRLSFLFASVLSILIINSVYAAQPKVVFGPVAYEREKGKPEEYQAAFDACDPDGSFKVIVENGDASGKDRVSSGTVSINGFPVVMQSDFNQNAGRLEKPVYGIKKVGNTIDVKLQSAPGSRVTVSVEGVMRCLEVHITSPANGDTISDYNAIIRGAIETQDGTEVGVTVNGVPAEVSGKAFAVAGVPMQEGENTIAVKATDEDGNTAEDSVKVTLANAAASPVYFSAYPASGQAPLDVKFTVDDTIPKAKVLYEFDWEGDGVVDASAQQLSDFLSGITHSYSSEGLYFPTVTIKSEDGEIFSKNTLVNVFKMPDLGKKWDNMKSALEAGDVEKAAGYFSLSTRDAFKQQFQVLAEAGVLKFAVGDMGEFTLNKIIGNSARGEMLLNVNGEIYSYFVSFIKDDDGIWRIQSF